MAALPNEIRALAEIKCEIDYKNRHDLLPRYRAAKDVIETLGRCVAPDIETCLYCEPDNKMCQNEQAYLYEASRGESLEQPVVIRPSANQYYF